MKKTKEVSVYEVYNWDGTLSKVEVNDALPQVIIPFRCKELPSYESDEPPLTIPNLEDTVELMLSRKIAGIQQQEFNSEGVRFYPTDPTSLTTALQFVKDRKLELEDKLKAQQKHIVETEKQARDKKQKDDADKKAFEDFKKRQEKLPELSK